MSRRSIGLAVAVLSLLVGIDACVAPGASVAPSSTGVRPQLSTPAQVLSVTRTYSSAGITLAPPNGRAPSVTAAAAYDLCRSGVADCPDGQPTNAELASMTDSSYGTQTNGTLQRTLTDTLVWALSWRNITCPRSSGGAFVPGASRPSAPAVSTICDEVAFVDATSGAFLITYTGPAAP